MSQCDQILAHLKRGKPLTPGGAMMLFGCYRLAARIQDLRHRGYAIDVERVESGGKRFARYRMVRSAT